MSHLLQWVLGSEEAESWCTAERGCQLRDIHFSPVIQYSVEALQYTLIGEIQLIQQHPRTGPDCSKQRPIAPVTAIPISNSRLPGV